jgi:hypothetical protein
LSTRWNSGRIANRFSAEPLPTSIAQLDVPGGRFLRARDRRGHAGAQRDDEHFIGADCFGTRIPRGGFLGSSILRHGLAEQHRQTEQQNLFQSYLFYHCLLPFGHSKRTLKY